MGACAVRWWGTQSQFCWAQALARPAHCTSARRRRLTGYSQLVRQVQSWRMSHLGHRLAVGRGRGLVRWGPVTQAAAVRLLRAQQVRPAADGRSAAVRSPAGAHTA
jgi:hypothetical protein